MCEGPSVLAVILLRFPDTLLVKYLQGLRSELIAYF